MRIPAVIFDLDGTLVDSEPLYYEAGRRTLAAHGVTGFSWERHLRFVGVGTEDTLRSLRAEYGLAAPVADLLAEMDGHYLALAPDAALLDGAVALARRLAAAGHPLAVASGSSRAAIDAALAGSGLAPLFGAVVSAQEVDRGKPAPDVFVEAARRLGADAAHCVVVEDSPPGVRAAAAAGMRCVAAPSVPARAGDEVFASVGLLFAGGPAAFDARAAFDWITGGPRPV
ncbi:HAD family hydrolase [Streptantibioticus silvisoli]|uniref:HAD family phosphatase n=1 Tax=Streptantibioticus silvisoli TaxID=2705255 RepID=A0ABT6W8B2_9ACTN|nr:HAD family phosphatase [Streptantibioticus silvisoli]MDI5966197.1 HAD family phosphatase [Streptantibioticus silvisoli]